jgi:hypothetical protein
MPETTETKLPDPQAGGQYVRNKDGSLTQVGKTEEAARASETAAASAPAAPATHDEE